MNYNDSVAYIHSLSRFGSKLGLERISKLLDMLGAPQKKLKFIHIAGTNGKGSTAAMCSSALTRCGYKTGLYISPFVIDFRERFQIDGEMISKNNFAAIASEVKCKIDECNASGDEITEFEAVTAIAFLYCAQAECDIVCLEVGLGGRYDATNVIESPLVSVITSISLDHTAVLGNTVAEIAAEKAGIIKDGGVTVAYPMLKDEALEVIMKECAKHNNQLVIPNKSSISDINVGLDGTEFVYGNERYKTGLCGIHQAYNTAVVIEVIRQLSLKDFTICWDKVKAAIASAAFPARFEILSSNPYVVIDGAHNADGLCSLKRTLSLFEDKKKIAVMAMMADKDYKKSVSVIAPEFNAVYCVSASNPRSLSAEELADTVGEFCADVYVSDSVSDALKQAKALSGSDGVVVVCGSLFLAADAKRIL